MTDNQSQQLSGNQSVARAQQQSIDNRQPNSYSSPALDDDVSTEGVSNYNNDSWSRPSAVRPGEAPSSLVEQPCAIYQHEVCAGTQQQQRDDNEEVE